MRFRKFKKFIFKKKGVDRKQQKVTFHSFLFKNKNKSKFFKGDIYQN
jgi:hypothetical protein